MTVSLPAAVDVVVVGGGPAGASAAATLAAAGRDVLVVDKATFPRDKYCGDGLTADALRRLERLGFRTTSLRSWQPVDDVLVRSPFGRTIRFPLPRGRGTYAAVVERAELDAAVLDLARDRGAAVIEGHPVCGAEARDDRIVVTVQDIGRVHARYAIGADGVWSPLRRILGAGDPGYRGDWHAFRQYFRGVCGPAAKELWVWFEPELLPGYAWSFPLAGGRANVGFGIQRGAKVALREMTRLWRDLLGRPHIREVLGEGAEPEAPHRAWPIPGRVDQVRLAAGRALFVGDAAAAADPMTGEGIAQAILTGELAADAILEAGPFRPDLAADRYRARVRRELFADVRMSRLLIRAIRHRRGVDWAMAVAGATPWTRRNFARWLFEDYPRAFVATPRRWPEHSLTARGAWAPSR